MSYNFCEKGTNLSAVDLILMNVLLKQLLTVERTNVGKVLEFIITKERRNENNNDDISLLHNANTEDLRGSISSLESTNSRKISYRKSYLENVPRTPDIDTYLLSELFSFQSSADVKVINR